MEKLLNADNLAIVVLALWVANLIFQNKELRKENKDNWQVLTKMARVIYGLKHKRTDGDTTGEFDALSNY